MTRICLSLTVGTVETAAQVIEANRRWISMVELRADFLDRSELEQVHRLPDMAGVPVIFTLRAAADGGRYEGPEAQRREYILRAAESGFQYVDVEDSVHIPQLAEAATRGGARVIRSRHDFEGVPADLAAWIRRVAEAGNEIPKAAVMPRCTADLVRLLTVYDRTAGVEKILLGMGAWGFVTRVLSGKLGSMVTFCSSGESAAPGHVNAQTMHDLYRAHVVGPETPVYCVIGNPVMHTRSPHIHNPAFAELRMPAVYVPIQVDDVDAFMMTAEQLDIRGMSVTVPHKQAVVRHLGQVDATVVDIGACNTVYRRDGMWVGLNSDAEGFLNPLLRAVGRADLSGMRAAVIGAGGTTRAVVYALRSAGCDVCVFNRTARRARELAERFGCAYGALAPESAAMMRKYADIVVQTTSVGMEPKRNADPAPFFAFRGTEIVYDVIYSPPETVFLQRAREAGCTTIDGRLMLVEQAVVQFRAFTGCEFPDSVRKLIAF